MRVLTHFIWLLEVLCGDWCPHMQWVLRLRDARDTHKQLLKNRITPVLMINLLWKVHQDSCQFFVGCERCEDGKPFPRSTLRTTVEALMDDIRINTTLTCPVAEFLGSSVTSHQAQQAGSRRHQEALWKNHVCRVFLASHFFFVRK
jgi:hypothetical protein